MKKFIYFCIVPLLSACSILTTPIYRSIELPANMRLIEATLEKDSSVWLYMESMDSTYIPKTKILQKNSKYGIVEKKFIFQESK
jgi:hypothetical protein